MAAAIRQVVSSLPDLAARYGGEEFAIILPEQSLSSSAKIAEKVRLQIKAINQSSLPSPVTASLGVATLIPAVNNSPKQLIEAADQALYSSKKQGRDRITIYENVG